MSRNPLRNPAPLHCEMPDLVTHHSDTTSAGTSAGNLVGQRAMYETIFYDVTDHLATITLNRPEKLNAYLSQMMEEIVEALDRADADDDVRAIIVTGAGRAFCAGADLSAGSSTFDYGKDGGANSPVGPDGKVDYGHDAVRSAGRRSVSASLSNWRWTYALLPKPHGSVSSLPGAAWA